MLIVLITGNVAKNVNKYEANHTGNIVLYCSDLKLWIRLHVKKVPQQNILR